MGINDCLQKTGARLRGLAKFSPPPAGRHGDHSEPSSGRATALGRALGAPKPASAYLSPAFAPVASFSSPPLSKQRCLQEGNLQTP
mmetsp:Transcript_14166/g.19529  ORF Transcript_14166/g.19529 Transcript_14166/m.19529 type:complete len:86 (-) Transcript_14166:317-574(-)